MANVIVLIIVAVLLLFALKGAIKHFKGEGSCCGGGSGSLPLEEKTLENPVIGKKLVRISGMHCQNCADAVTKALDKIDSVSAKVSLKGKKAIVSYDSEVDEERLRKAVEDAGYQVVSIESM